MYNADMKNKKVKPDKKEFLNNKKYRKRFKIIKTFIYSRLFSVWILILAQLALMAFFCFKLEKYLPYYLGGSVAISILFLCYLVNSRGKNEFKIAWLLPVIPDEFRRTAHRKISQKNKRRLSCFYAPSR